MSSFAHHSQKVYWRWRFSELVQILSLPANVPLTGRTVGEALWARHRLDARDSALYLYAEDSSETLLGMDDPIRPFSRVVAVRMPAKVLGPVRLEKATISERHRKMQA